MVCPVSFLSRGSPGSKKAALYLQSLRTVMIGSVPSPATWSPAGCIPLTYNHPSQSKILRGRMEVSSAMESSVVGERYRQDLSLFHSTTQLKRTDMGMAGTLVWWYYRVGAECRTFIYTCMYKNMCIYIKGPNSYFGNFISCADTELH